MSRTTKDSHQKQSASDLILLFLHVIYKKIVIVNEI